MGQYDTRKKDKIRGTLQRLIADMGAVHLPILQDSLSEAVGEKIGKCQFTSRLHELCDAGLVTYLNDDYVAPASWALQAGGRIRKRPQSPAERRAARRAAREAQAIEQKKEKARKSRKARAARLEKKTSLRATKQEHKKAMERRRLARLLS